MDIYEGTRTGLAVHGNRAGARRIIESIVPIRWLPMPARARRIGVLTFHRCINYGSYWQARCLVEGLRQMGHEAELLDHQSAAVRRAEWRCAFQPSLPERTPRHDFPRYAAKARAVLKAVEALPRSPRFPLDRPQESGARDCVVIGSDEVWNLSHPWYGGVPIFYGAGLEADRLVSYAASFGNYDADAGLHPAWAERLGRFDAISVRDDNSRRLVEDAVGCAPAFVLDPVLQFPPMIEAPTSGEPYVALYGHSFPEWFRRAVRAWADGRGLRLMSIGYRNRWADAHEIEAGPIEFSRLIAGAAAVVTNFFHGCVFAVLNAKPFACAASAYRANKLRDLTVTLGAERHLVWEDAPGMIADALDQPLDAEVGRRLGTLRVQSSAYLSAALA